MGAADVSARLLLLQELFNSLLVREVVILALSFESAIVTVFASGGILELLVPDLLDLFNFTSAEVEPLLHDNALLDRFGGLVVLIIGAALLVKDGLSDVSELKGNLDDLSHIHVAGTVS